MDSPHPPSLPAEISSALHRSDGWRHARRIGIFLILYAAAGIIAVNIANRNPGWWILLLTCWLLMAASLHGISLFTHEAVHGTLSRSRVWNAIGGAACAVPALQNFSAYRVLHLRHHRHLGEDGDPDHYANYTRWTWMVFCMNWLRLLFGYPVYITMIPILGFKHGNRSDRIKILCELAATGMAAFGVWAAGASWLWFLHCWLIPMIFINTMVNIRGMSQHTLLEHSDDVRGTRSILTASWVRFFMCNENYYLEHHLYPGVPWHHLPEVYAHLNAELRQKGAPYIGSYTAFVRAFMRHSIERSPLNRSRR